MGHSTPEKRRAYQAAKRAAMTPEQREGWRERYRLRDRAKAGIVGATGETRTGPCAICHRDMKLHLDHDHVTGLVRGWLCVRCNVGLGYYEKHGAAFAAYLKKTS